MVQQGDVISLDGSTGEIILGELKLAAAEPPPEFEILLGWADDVRRGKLKVRANADNGPDAKNAREFGAEGIGLCRTEHMFLGEDRLPVVRRMILAEDGQDETDALEELRKVQKTDFVEILDAMDGLPVTVRLLDPPLHEFLPRVDELEVKAATVGLDDEEERPPPRRPELARVQPDARHPRRPPGRREARPLRHAGARADGGRGRAAGAGEEPHRRGHDPADGHARGDAPRPRLGRGRHRRPAPARRPEADVTIGTMIETPRAALRADEIALESDFFSFGTNDLTQMTFGFSRDDVESRMMPAYLEQGLLKRNPFETIDQTGVGELVKLAAQRGRAVRKDLKLGVCGEHGGDPESIRLFYEAGLDYVSCSPFRVPIARLAAAQAVLGAGGADTR